MVRSRVGGRRMGGGRRFHRIAWVACLSGVASGAIGDLAGRTTPVALGMLCMGLALACIALEGLMTGRLRDRGVDYEAHRDRAAFGCLAATWGLGGVALMLYAAAILLGLVELSQEDARAIVRFWEWRD